MNNAKKPLLLGSMILTAILVAANLVVTNLMVRSFEKGRYDLTEDKRFEIGKGTTNILDRLDGQVTIKCFVSENLPQRFAHVQRTIVEKLQEYEAVSKGKLIYEFLDPSTDNDAGRQAKQDCTDLGIVSVKQSENKNVLDISKLVDCYLALAIFHGDRKTTFQLFELGAERIEDAAELAADLEWVISSSIQRVSTPRLTIGVLGDVQEVPSNPYDPRSEKVKTLGIARLQQALERNYDVVLIDIKQLNAAAEIPAEISTLVVYRPLNFAPIGIYKLDQYLMHGGKIFFLVDNGTVDNQPKRKQVMMGNVPVNDFDMPTYAGQPLTTGLDEFFKHLGVDVESSLVLDRSCIKMPYYKDRVLKRDPFGNHYAEGVPDEKDYPAFPLVPARGADGELLDSEQLNPKQAMVARLATLLFVWASPIKILPENLARHDDTDSDGKTIAPAAEVLIRSGPESWSVPIAGGVFSQARGMDDAPAERSSSNLMVMLKGRFRSFYRGKDIPTPEADDGNPAVPTEEQTKSRLDEAAARSTVVVLGDADFVSDGVTQSVANLEWQRTKNEERTYAKLRSAYSLVSQTIDVLSYGGTASDLIDLRNKRLRSREILRMESDDSRRQKNDLINFAVIPGVILLFGLARLLVRWSTTGDSQQPNAA